jgi:hypothetical protein
MTTPLTAGELPVGQVRSWAESGGLYAVVDACDAPSVPSRAQELGDQRAVSLYKGRAEQEMWAIAPYLIAVDGVTYDWITSDLWGTPWGFLVIANDSLETLRHHFRKFLTVKTPAGEEWYFRFYDPRVLRKYLDSCTPTERAEFFGPARAVGLTNPDTYAVTVMTASDTKPSAKANAPTSPRQ